MYWFTSLKDAENLVFDELTFVVILPLVASLKLTEFTFPFSSKFKITFDNHQSDYLELRYLMNLFDTDMFLQ